MKSLKPIYIFFCWLLIGLYALSYVGRDVIHNEVHKHEAASHTEKFEKDPCHRSVFHGEADTHKNHFTASKYCPSCHVISPSQDLADVFTIAPDVDLSEIIATPHLPLSGQQIISLHSSRAPPFIA